MKKKILALLLVCLMLCAALAGCASKDAATMENTSGIYWDGGAYDYVTEPGAPMAPSEEEFGYSKDSVTGNTVQSSESPRVEAEKIIYTGNITMETLDFDATISALDSAVSELGGFVQYTNITGDTSYDSDGTVHIMNRRASYTVRIPAGKLDEFLSRSGTLGNVTSSSKSAQNVTSQYRDNEARMVTLTTEESRLLELMAKADDINALITLESRLSDVRYQIESIQRTLNDLDSKVAFSTVELYIREVRVYQPTVRVQRTFWERLSDSFVGGWEDFVDGLQDFFVGLAGSMFTLILLAGVFFAVFFTVRRAVKKRKAKKAAAKKEEDPE